MEEGSRNLAGAFLAHTMAAGQKEQRRFALHFYGVGTIMISCVYSSDHLNLLEDSDVKI